MGYSRSQAVAATSYTESAYEDSIEELNIPSTKSPAHSPCPYNNQEFTDMKLTLGLRTNADGIEQLATKVNSFSAHQRTISFVTSATRYRLGYSFSNGFSPGEFAELKGIDEDGCHWKATGQNNTGRYKVSINHLPSGEIEYNISFDQSIIKARLDIGKDSYLIDPALI